jgi:ankyrin repeat protein
VTRLELIDSLIIGYQTPLLQAVEKGNQAIIRLLLEKGARPDFATSGGETALSMAKWKGDRAIIELLESYMIFMIFPTSSH